MTSSVSSCFFNFHAMFSPYDFSPYSEQRAAQQSGGKLDGFVCPRKLDPHQPPACGGTPAPMTSVDVFEYGGIVLFGFDRNVGLANEKKTRKVTAGH